MNVIAIISCYFERSVVTLKLRKEYLNTVTYNIPVLLRIKYWTVWYVERYSVTTYTGVSNFQKTVWFFLAHPVYTRKYLSLCWSCVHCIIYICSVVFITIFNQVHNYTVTVWFTAVLCCCTRSVSLPSFTYVLPVFLILLVDFCILF